MTAPSTIGWSGRIAWARTSVDTASTSASMRPAPRIRRSSRSQPSAAQPLAVLGAHQAGDAGQRPQRLAQIVRRDAEQRLELAGARRLELGGPAVHADVLDEGDAAGRRQALGDFGGLQHRPHDPAVAMDEAGLLDETARRAAGGRFPAIDDAIAVVGMERCRPAATERGPSARPGDDPEARVAEEAGAATIGDEQARPARDPRSPATRRPDRPAACRFALPWRDAPRCPRSPHAVRRPC